MPGWGKGATAVVKTVVREVRRVRCVVSGGVSAGEGGEGPAAAAEHRRLTDATRLFQQNSAAADGRTDPTAR